MPSTSKAQHNLMEGIAHGWRPSGMKKPPPVSVAKDFAAADKGRDFRGMKNGRKDNGPGELEQAEDTREIDAMKDQVARRSKKIKARRNRS